MSIDVWAGPECTVNRVGSGYLDQVVLTGHQRRLRDLELFAELGVRKLRYPVLWERTAPDGDADWRWADERLGQLRQLGITPIAGLLHHGSGPRATSLDDPLFPKKFSAFARAVAERYPWITDYTPINEPLTTARFIGLYGHWYPHASDDRTFSRALINQCSAIVLAMQQIRQVNSDAQLIQTEDLGKVFSVPRLAYQAQFENQRRWLSFDLLCGRVNRVHPLWRYLVASGISEAELFWLLENAAPPDIFGMNYYVTSDRFLDDRLEFYPESMHGGNGRERYADVEAVRVEIAADLGHAARLEELWDRYRRPTAITEVHLGCTVDEQLRWLHQAWTAANKVRESGADIRAVTAWALLGSFDWDSLLTRNQGHYEPGVFDVREGTPCPTALASYVTDIANGRVPSHPALESRGWWRRPERLSFTESRLSPEVIAA